MSKVLCLGNALLDVSAPCLLSALPKYHLEPDENAEATDEHNLLFTDLLGNPDAINTPGGSAQNTARVAQWVFNSFGECQATFVGCIGNDEYGKRLREFMKDSKVNTIYDVHNSAPTGVAAGLVTEDNRRSVCARLGAAALFNPDFLQTDDVQLELKNSKIIYSEGYFLSHNPDCVLTLAKFVEESSMKLFALNLSAVYICESEFETLKKCVLLSDIVIGNIEEAVAFATGCKLPCNTIKECALTISSLPCKKDQTRIMVITQGAAPVIVASGNTVTLYEVPVVKELGDTIGCGDAFVGGFLAALCADKTVEVATQWGIYCGTNIAKTRGCALPSFPADMASLNDKV